MTKADLMGKIAESEKWSCSVPAGSDTVFVKNDGTTVYFGENSFRVLDPTARKVSSRYPYSIASVVRRGGDVFVAVS